MPHTARQRLILSSLVLCLSFGLMGQTLSRRELGLVNPLEFGAACTSATLQAAITSVGANNRTLMLTVTDRAGNDCTWTITTNIIVPANIVLWVSHGAVANIDAGITLTLNRYPRVDNPAWHTGSGSVKITDPYPPNGAILVEDHAVSGTGTVADPYLGWETNTPWAPHTTFVFRSGTYAYSTQPAWSQHGIQLRGVGHVILQWQGSGPAMALDAGSGTGQILGGVVVDNLQITGNAGITHGLYLRGVIHSTFQHVRLGPFLSNTHAALLMEFGVLNAFYDLKITPNVTGTWVMRPLHGIQVSRRGIGAERSTDNLFVNVTIEDVTLTNGAGIYILHGDSNIFLGGTSEYNNQGIVVGANSLRNSFSNVFLEANTRSNIDEGGDHTHYINMLSGGATTASQNIVEATAAHTLFLGGQYTQDLTILAGAGGTQLMATRIDGILNNNGTDTNIVNSLITGDRLTRLPTLDGISGPIVLGQNGVGVAIGQTGHDLKKYFTTTVAYPGGTIPDNTEVILASANVSGLLLGDTCSVSLSIDTQGLMMFGYVDAPGHIKVRARNGTGSAVTLGSATVRLACAQH